LFRVVLYLEVFPLDCSDAAVCGGMSVKRRALTMMSSPHSKAEQKNWSMRSILSLKIIWSARKRQREQFQVPLFDIQEPVPDVERPLISSL
jgi:hypothetical protein